MIKLYTSPEAASQAARSAWLEMRDNTGLVPAVFEVEGGFEPGVWPRGRLDDLPEGAWVVLGR